MDDSKKYLSDRLLSEEVPVTYRLLSRALNIRVNVAKQKLYEFYENQNASKANSIHATYLVYGSKTEDREPEAGDTEMDSSVPEPEPLSDYAPTKTFTIVAEENLNDVLAEYEEITSFHIYSLAPFPQRDLALLSDVSKSLSEYRKIEDAAKSLDTYGIIANPQARKKDRKGRPPVAAPAPAPAPSAPKALKQETQSAVPKPSQPEKVKQEAKEAPSSDTTPSSSAGKKPPATLKRGASGGIMQSFAKAAAKPPKPKAKPEPKVEEDTSMALSDDGEADEEDLPAAKSIDLEALKRTRKEREEQLMRMMEDAEDETKEEIKKDDEQSDEEMEEASEPEPEPESEPEPEQPKEEKEPAEVVSNSSDGRRRGKRRVMKKKRILDDQGYMVTIQEAAWESFSEDEAPPPPTLKSTPASTPAASSTQKSKKAAATGKSGSQGSIMSFFAKK